MKKLVCLILGLILCFGLFGCGEDNQSDNNTADNTPVSTSDNSQSTTDGQYNVDVIGQETHELLQSYIEEIGNIYEADDFDKLLQEKPEQNIELLGYSGNIEFATDTADANTGAQKIYGIGFETDTYYSEDELEKFAKNISEYFGYELAKDSNGDFNPTVNKPLVYISVYLTDSNNHINLFITK